MKKILVLFSFLASMLVGNTDAQTLRGGFDQFFGNVSAFGWACFPDQPGAKLAVYVGVYDGVDWVYYGQAPADKQRNDIGRSGICGSPADIESYYHGFEMPVLPLNQLSRNQTYGVYAWIYTNTSPYSQFINGGGSINTSEFGLPTSRIWRTDYDDPNLRQPALLSCIWPFHGANQRAIPGTPKSIMDFGTNPTPTNLFMRYAVGGGATPAGAGLNGTTQIYPRWIGFDTPNNYCLNFPANTTIPAPWSISNSAAGSPSGSMWPTAANGYPTWPTYNYWVIHANNEGAFQLVTIPGFMEASSGPPSQSEPVTGGLFSVNSNSTGFTLAIDTNYGTHKAKLPFLSVGAQMGRGIGGPLAYVDPSGLETFVEFDITRLAAPTPGPGSYQAIDFIAEAIFNGSKRQIWISLGVSQESVRVNWNWNAAQSFWYPGADLNRFYGSEALACPNMPSSSLIPNLAHFPIGVTKSVSIPLRAMFKCVDALPWDSARKWGYSPLAYGLPLLISGIHVGIEDGNISAGQHIVSISAPQFVRR